MKELMLALMVWASAHTGLPVPDRLPQIVPMERCELHQMVTGGQPCPPPGSGIQAAYHHNHVYLQRDWSADDLFSVSALLHELVHHMQFEAGVLAEGTCKHTINEPPAYDAQIAFLEAAGVDAHEVMGVNELFLRFMRHCDHG